MTCAIVWRSNNQIHLASDSRITFKTGPEVDRYADIGVKVMSLYIGVTGTDYPINSIFQGVYGFCYAGSLHSGTTFKNLIEEILRSFQYIGDGSTVSFKEICEYVVRISSSMTQVFFEELLRDERWKFIICGYCPLNQSQKAALFSFTFSDGKAIANFSEVAENNDEFCAIGQGESDINKDLLNQQLTTDKVLCSLYNLTQNENFKGVGGDIQYGCINGELFSIYGIVLILQTNLIKPDGSSEHIENERIYCYRGLRIMEGKLMAHPLNSAVFPSGISWTTLTLTSSTETE